MIDFSRIRIILNLSKIQVDNIALYQVISQMLDGLVELSKPTASRPDELIVYEIDTSSPVTAIQLDAFVREFTVIKDVTGNAVVNNINLIGTVDGVVNPSLTTNYGVIRIFRNSKTGEYHQW